jgi:hypothetical protein
MAFTTGHGGEERHQDLQDVHRLHRAQQTLTEGLLSTPPD